MTDLDRLLFQLQRVIPHEQIRGPLRLLGEGFYSTAVLSAEGMVFRIGRAPRAAEGYAREAAVLPALHGLLPVDVPQPGLFVPGGGERFPYGLLAYPALPGDAFDPSALTPVEREFAAQQVAAVILSLQRIPPARFGLVDDFSARWSGWSRCRDLTLPALREALRDDEYRALGAWWHETLSDGAMGCYTPVFHHGDLWYGNMLAEGARITAVLDWSELGAGDPAQDFVPQFYPGDDFFEQVAEAFRRLGGAALDAGFRRRAARLRVLRELGGLEYSILQNDAAEFDDSVAKLRREMGFDRQP